MEESKEQSTIYDHSSQSEGDSHKILSVYFLGKCLMTDIQGSNLNRDS